MLSRDQEIQLLEDDIRDAERRLRSLERAPIEGRWTRTGTEWMDACANMQKRINHLELMLTLLRVEELA